MTDNILERVAIMCAAAGFTPSEWDQLVVRVKYTDAEQSRKLYRMVRNRVRHIRDDTDHGDEARHGSEQSSSQMPAVREVENMMRTADMPLSEAVEIVYAILRNERGINETGDIVYNSKSGLKKWIAKTIDAYGENAVLSAAVRGLRGYSGHSDWRLD